MVFSLASKNTARRFRITPAVIAVLLALILLLWLASGEMLRAQEEAPEPTDGSRPATELPRVEVQVIRAQTYGAEQVAQGQLLPVREVEIRSQTSSHLASRMVELGDVVAAGDSLFQLNNEDRQVQLARAEADLALAEAELRAGERLLERELMSQTDYLRLQAAISSARAAREQAELQQEYTHIRAPFAGIIDRLPVEEGDFIQVGESLGALVDVRALELSAFVPQQQVHALQVGLPVEARLLDGSRLSGQLRYVAARADSDTRSFRVEALIDNPDLRRIAGGSATIAIKLPLQQAHRLSPAYLVLDDEGQLGVKIVNEQSRVEVVPVSIIGFDTDGVWLEGLPQEAMLITQGGGFVEAGQAVNALRAEGS